MGAKKLIENTFGTVLALTIVTFVVVFIAYGCSGVEDQLKETLTITIGFFGGFATLGAAFIAAYLFNDWRDQSIAELKSQRCLKINNDLFEVDKLVSSADIFMQILKTNNDDQLLSLLGKSIGVINNDLKSATTGLFNQIEKDKGYLLTSIEYTYFNELKGNIYDIQNILTCAPHFNEDKEYIFSRYILRMKEYKEQYASSKKILDKYISYN
ncbi:MULTISPECIES: hypothetical protein [Acinetobacter]|jgi:uncharacterized membrane protein|uniref:DUF4760 domain-containing protein n=1 Tax=Acinetobacter bouvetii TaxID=202951 RepID=A0A4Q7AR18_9GAMM|nr:MULTISPECIES: hypothetical protein [Acinetobacter]RZG64531.1 hypothetical protein EXE25_16230 [Acinetobacter bouvetii]TCB76158.1 hypothetical protein E0H91_02490 [Acinetobacter sp. ANC 4177]